MKEKREMPAKREKKNGPLISNKTRLCRNRWSLQNLLNICAIGVSVAGILISE